jgi:hypothetical protein
MVDAAPLLSVGVTDSVSPLPTVCEENPLKPISSGAVASVAHQTQREDEINPIFQNIFEKQRETDQNRAKLDRASWLEGRIDPFQNFRRWHQVQEMPRPQLR